MAEVLSPEKRNAIVAGAARVFAQDGYEGASMARIAMEAGVSKGTLYNHFDSKAALFGAFVEGECERNLARIFDSEFMDEAPERVLLEVAGRMLRLVLSPAGLTIYRVVVSEAAKFPDLARRFHEAGPSRAVAHMAGWLRRETQAGRLAVPDPAFAAEQFLALCQTDIAMKRKLMIISEPEEAAIERVAAASVSMFLNTYRA